MKVIWCIGLLLVLVSHGNGITEVSHQRHRHRRSSQFISEDQPYRTAYHFQPPKNWMNDPNGPMYHNGVYHLFYQYNPYGAVWGNISWGHSISYDLVDWVHLDIVLNPTDPFDINGCWSGSVTFLNGKNPVILYTGSDTQNRQVQNLAVPKNNSDPFLREWTKCPHNPLMSTFNEITSNNFRDPTTAWLGPDKLWRVLVGAEIAGNAMALLYKSRDFINWKRLDTPLHSSTKTNMWECPDFYPVLENSTYGSEAYYYSSQQRNVKHVLKASFNDRDHYILGRYAPEIDEYVVESDFLDVGADLRYDYGKFYASKSFYDSEKRRRVLWGWITESDSVSDDKNKGWSGLQSFPRSVVLSNSGRQLVQWPINEIEKLRSKNVTLQDKELQGDSAIEISGVTASQADVEVSFDILELEKAESMDPSWVDLDPQVLCSQKNASVRGNVGPFGLLVLASKDLTEQTAIFFRIFKSNKKYVVLMCSDQSRSSLTEGLDKTTYGTFVDLDPQREKITLRSLIDHSIIESFGGEGKSCITSRVYPNIAINKEAHLYVFNYGIKDVKILTLNAWSMKSARIAALRKRRRPPMIA